MAGFVTIEQVGPSIDMLVDKMVRELKVANREAGRMAARVGRKAMLDDVKARRGSLSIFGSRLDVKTKVKASADGATVDYRGVTAGAWAIVSTGTKPHTIRRRNAKALHWGGGGVYSMVVQHPGTAGGGYWQHAGAALDKALGIGIAKVYDETLAA